MKRMIALLLAAALCFSLLPTVSLGAAVPVQTDPIRKVDGNLLLEIADKPDDELVTVTLWLKGPAREEIEALVPMEKPGADAPREERDAYQSEYAQVQAGICSGIYDRFMDKYRDPEADQIVTSEYDDQPHLQMIVRKDRIPVFAAVDEVLWINRGESVYLQYDTPAAEKITDPLHEIMDKAAQDQLIPVRVWLRGMTGEEILPLVPVSFPTFTSTAAEIRAYLDASTQVWQSLTDDLFLYGQFTDNHREEFGEVLFQSKKIPVMAGTATAEKIRALAGLQMVRSIDPAVGFDEALPDPELPEDPAALKKIDSRLREFMTIATHDEMIPVSIDLKDPPAEEIDALIPSGSENDRLARNEASRQVYSTLNAGFVQDHLDEGDEVIFVSSYLSNIRATVPKHKIAGLAALDDVTSIVWIPFHDDPVYSDNTQVVPVPPRDSQPPVDPAVYDKLAPYLIEKLEGAPNSAKIPIDISLVAPSEEEILAQFDISVPGAGATMEEMNAYISALRRAKKEVYSAITSAFVENYLDENDTVRVRGNYIPTLIVEVPKPKVFSLAALEEVTSIGWAGGYTTVYPTGPGSSVPSEEPDYMQKIDPYLLGYIQNAANDELVRVEFELNALSRAELEAQTGLTAPDLSSTMDEIRAWNRAVKEIYEPLFEAFYRKLDVNNEVEGDFIRNLTPTVWTVLPKGKALSLAALDEVQALNYYDEYTEAMPPPLWDKAALADAIGHGEYYLENYDADHFPPAAYSAFLEALETARALMADEKAPAYDVDRAAHVLYNAIDALRPAQDWTEINRLTKVVNNFDPDRYTAESVAAYYEILEGVNLEDLESARIQGELDAAAAIIRQALAALVEKDTETVPTTVKAKLYCADSEAEPHGDKILSEQALTEYLRKYHNGKAPSAISGYDEAFFREKALVFTFIRACGSGPAYSVQSVSETATRIKIALARPNEPETPDMAWWILVLEMDRDAAEKEIWINSDLHDAPPYDVFDRTTHEIAVTWGPGGYASGAGYYEPGEQVTLQARPSSFYAFEGWYENGEKVEGAGTKYSFIVEGDRALEVQFTYTGTAPKSDKSALRRAVELAELLPAADHTPESYAGLSTAIEKAKSFLDMTNATQDQIDGALSDLIEAVKLLEYQSYPVKSALYGAILAAEALDLDQYTEESSAGLREQIEIAKEILARSGMTQEAVDAAAQALNEEVQRLAITRSKLAPYLVEQMEAAADDEIINVAVWLKCPTDAEIEAMIPVPDPGEFGSREEIEAYFSAKRQVQREVISAITTEFAENHLDESNPIYFRGNFIPQVEFGATKAQIRALAELDEVTQIDWIDDPYLPIEQLSSKEILEKVIKEAEKINEEDYTPESYAALKEALIAAETVLAREDATQEDFEVAANALHEAMASAVGVPGIPEKPRRELEIAVTECERLDKELYTEESVERLEQACAAARAILEKADATREELDFAAKALNEALSALVEIKPEPPQFEDVRDHRSFYFTPVYWAYNAQITNGTDEVHFGPEEACTRGQVVTFLWRAAGCPAPKSTGTPFADVGPKAFYARAVAWAVEQGITKGMSDDTFAPNATCTRGQIVTFLWRFRQSPAPKSTGTPFTDVGPKAFYAKAVGWAVENEITNGMTKTTFAPDATCTRGQVVTFLYRAMDSMI